MRDIHTDTHTHLRVLLSSAVKRVQVFQLFIHCLFLIVIVAVVVVFVIVIVVVVVVEHYSRLN